jgi:hypothetical protein
MVFNKRAFNTLCFDASQTGGGPSGVFVTYADPRQATILY